MSTSSLLTVTVIEAKLYRDVEIFSEMDPYVVIEYNGNTYKTPTI